MATNLNIRDDLIQEAQQLGKHKTKKEAVTIALEEYIRRKRQLKILTSFGTVQFDPHYNYKKQRKRT